MERAYLDDGTPIVIDRNGNWRRAGKAPTFVRQLEESGYVCLREIGDEGLRSLLTGIANRKKCSLCGRRRLAVSFTEVTTQVGAIFRALFQLGDLKPAHAFSSEESYELYWQEGRSAEEIIEQITKTTTDLATAIFQSLSFAETLGASKAPFFARRENLFVGKSAQSEKLHLWRHFCGQVLRGPVELNGSSYDALDQVFGSLGELRPSVVRTLRKGLSVFRARLACGWKHAEAICDNAIDQLAAPPPSLARPGRMATPGVPAFYLAFAKHVAIAEVRPDVGDMVVVIRLQTLEPIRVLDLSAFLSNPNLGSVFTGDFRGRAKLACFLAEFDSVMSYPLSPGVSERGYLPTQVVCAYLHDRLGVDGIIYPSYRSGTTKAVSTDFRSKNLAFFQGPGALKGCTGVTDTQVTPKFKTYYRELLPNKLHVKSTTIGYERIYSKPSEYVYSHRLPTEGTEEIIADFLQYQREIDGTAPDSWPKYGPNLDDYLESVEPKRRDSDGLLFDVGDEFEDDIPF